MHNFFIDKFEYNQFSNRTILQLLTAQPSLYSGKIKTLLSHTLTAHHIWNQRVLNRKSDYLVWQEFEIDELKNIQEKNTQESLLIIETKELDAEIRYTNSKELKFSNTIGDILFHIINHSTYHRGQMMSEIKKQGGVPIGTDYIFYKRN